MSSITVPGKSPPTVGDSDSSAEDLQSSDDSIYNNQPLTESNIEKERQGLLLRTQKSLISRLATNRHSIRPIIGKTASDCLKSFEKLLKAHEEVDGQAKQVTRALVKTIAKLGFILSERKMTADEEANFTNVKNIFRRIAMDVITFSGMDFTYNVEHLLGLMNQCQRMLCGSVEAWLSRKSVDRIEFVFRTIGNANFLNRVFNHSASRDKKERLTVLASQLQALVKSEVI